MSTALKLSTCRKSQPKPLSLIVRPATLASAAHSACECRATPAMRRSNNALTVVTVHVVEARARACESRRWRSKTATGAAGRRAGHSGAYCGSQTRGAQEYLEQRPATAPVGTTSPKATGVGRSPRV